jgi:hypothetical protein
LVRRQGFPQRPATRALAIEVDHGHVGHVGEEGPSLPAPGGGNLEGILVGPQGAAGNRLEAFAQRLVGGKLLHKTLAAGILAQLAAQPGQLALGLAGLGAHPLPGTHAAPHVDLGAGLPHRGGHLGKGGQHRALQPRRGVRGALRDVVGRQVIRHQLGPAFARVAGIRPGLAIERLAQGDQLAAGGRGNTAHLAHRSGRVKRVGQGVGHLVGRGRQVQPVPHADHAARRGVDAGIPFRQAGAADRRGIGNAAGHVHDGRQAGLDLGHGSEARHQPLHGHHHALARHGRGGARRQRGQAKLSLSFERGTGGAAFRFPDSIFIDPLPPTDQLGHLR